MATLYLLRHGRTVYNCENRVQGRCDSPLTELGVAQAHAAGAWLAERGVRFDRIFSSPLGRALSTAQIVREELMAARRTGGHEEAGGAEEQVIPEVEAVDGLMERAFGRFEGGPAEDVPCELWDPGEALVPYGGEGSIELRERMVSTLTGLMCQPGVEEALAVSHGSATLQFKLAWEAQARCPQDVHLGNCCVLVYEFDPASRVFVNTEIVNQTVGER